MATTASRESIAQQKIQPFIDDWAERAGSDWAAFRNFAVGQILWDAAPSDEQIERAVEIDGANDFGIDSWYYDPDEGGPTLYLVQAKQGKVALDDLRKLRNGFEEVMNPELAFKANVRLQGRALEFREMMSQDTRIEIHLVSRRIATPNLKKAVEQSRTREVRIGEHVFTCEAFVDDVESLAENLKLLDNKRIEAAFTVKRSHYFEIDPPGGLKTVSAAVEARELAALYNKNETNLFRLNPRYYLGKNAINKEMAATLESDPVNFYLYNNGLTATCDSVSSTSNGEDVTLTFDDFQIVNGCQTTVTIHRVDKSSQGEKTRDVLVPIRIIVTSQAPDKSQSIARATNRQTAMKPQDFRSSEDVHERLHAQFDRLKPRWYYEYKRGFWVTDVSGVRARAPYSDGEYSPRLIKLQDLAQACLAFCGLPHVAADLVRDYFNDDEKHRKLFPENVTAHQVLLPFLLFLEVSRKSRTRNEELKLSQSNTDWSRNYIRFPVVAAVARVLRYLLGSDRGERLSSESSDELEAYFSSARAQELIESFSEWAPRLIDTVFVRTEVHFRELAKDGRGVRSLVRQGDWREGLYGNIKDAVDYYLGMEAEFAREHNMALEEHGLRKVLPIVLPSPGG